MNTIGGGVGLYRTQRTAQGKDPEKERQEGPLAKRPLEPLQPVLMSS